RRNHKAVWLVRQSEDKSSKRPRVEESLWIGSWFANARETGFRETWQAIFKPKLLKLMLMVTSTPLPAKPAHNGDPWLRSIKFVEWSAFCPMQSFRQIEYPRKDLVYIAQLPLQAEGLLD